MRTARGIYRLVIPPARAIATHYGSFQSVPLIYRVNISSNQWDVFDPFAFVDDQRIRNSVRMLRLVVDHTVRPRKFARELDQDRGEGVYPHTHRSLALYDLVDGQDQFRPRHYTMCEGSLVFFIKSSPSDNFTTEYWNIESGKV